MKVLFSLTSFVCISLCLCFTTDTKTSSYVGYGYDLKSNRPIYNEYHEEEWVDGKHVTTTTVYKNEKGVVMASRKLKFSQGSETPGYRLDVKKTGYYEGAEIIKSGVRVYAFDEEAKKESSKMLEVPSPFVIDGGFNYFIKKRWESIVAGKTVSFYFVVPARLDYYHFRARKVSNLKEKGHNAMLVILEPDNFVLRSIVQPIKVTYDLASKRILKYEGISNIPGPEDRNFDIRLVYPELGA
ncbi:MAG: hypothetical protein V4616_11045 [Bacteroidota bacterium]